MAGLFQQSEQGGLGWTGAGAVHAVEFVDKIDEIKQRHEGQGDEDHRTGDVTVKQAANGLHARAARLKGRYRRLP